MQSTTKTPAATLFSSIAQAAECIAHFPNRKRSILHPDMLRRTGVLNAWSCPRTGDGGDETGLQKPAYPGGRREAEPRDDIRPTLLPEKAVSYELSASGLCGTLSLGPCPQSAARPHWNADRSGRHEVRQNVCTGNPGLNAHESGKSLTPNYQSTYGDAKRSHMCARTAADVTPSLWTSPRTTGSTEPKLRQAGRSGDGNTHEMRSAARDSYENSGASAALYELCSSLVGRAGNAPREYTMTLERGEQETGSGVRDDAEDGEITGNLLPQAVTADRRAQCGLFSTTHSTRSALISTGVCSGRQQNKYGPPGAAPSRDMKAAAFGSQNTFLKGLETFLSLGRDTTIRSRFLLNAFSFFSTSTRKIFQEA